MPIDYQAAEGLLKEGFDLAEAAFLRSERPVVPEHILGAAQTIFLSRTQAYREVLLGCVIARIQDQDINIRQPYVNQGTSAFNGRTLDETVINPFFQENRVPSSRGPYLGVFRRSVQFVGTTRGGLRDKDGYDAFLTFLTDLESTGDDVYLNDLLVYVLYKFIELREASNVPLARLQRISLNQYDALLSALLATPSGGRFPVLLIVAAFRAINAFFNADWTIDSQGINVADSASGVGGDVTITQGNRTIMVVEITERPVDRSRVVTTFNTKIAPEGIEDYLFFTRLGGVEQEAYEQAHRYFAQGHEINFLEIKNWILMTLATMGRQGRSTFNSELLELIGDPEIPSSLKVSWNDHVSAVLG